LQVSISEATTAQLSDGSEAGHGCRNDAAWNVDQHVAPQHGLSPSLVFRWRRLMSQGGKEAWIPERSATLLRKTDLNVLSKLGNQGLE
jgi:hypothetical protein